MKQLRSIGVFLIVCSILCGLIAYERYRTARNTAMAVAEVIEGIEFVGVTPPLTTVVAGLLGVMLFVAGLKCVFDSSRQPDSQL
jgi:hypothetical protein